MKTFGPNMKNISKILKTTGFFLIFPGRVAAPATKLPGCAPKVLLPTRIIVACYHIADFCKKTWRIRISSGDKEDEMIPITVTIVERSSHCRMKEMI